MVTKGSLDIQFFFCHQSLNCPFLIFIKILKFYIGSKSRLAMIDKGLLNMSWIFLHGKEFWIFFSIEKNRNLEAFVHSRPKSF
ncbi:hypothetical protein KUTeg_004913 [Tegillarca granosa]|uniref:Uncharacterized protein n=1 Tax=Tegillarca granosa TaxID=220873 RepID=A0ABQ9FIB4_TEGGR|nr:hypothetical protein KUTeg_004913 [Tegillarca granosa]